MDSPLNLLPPVARAPVGSSLPPLPRMRPAARAAPDFSAFATPEPVKAPDFSSFASEAPEAEGSRLKSAGASFVQAVGSGLASVPKGAAISTGAMLQSARKVTFDKFDELDAGGTLTPDQLRSMGDVDGPNVVAEYAAADPAGRAAIRGRFKEIDPRSMSWYKAGAGFEKIVNDAVPTDPKYSQEFLAGTVPQALGSAASFMATGLLGKIAKLPMLLTIASTGAAAEASSQFDDALQHGASLDDAYKTSGLAGAVGTSEALPIAHLLERLDRGTGGMVKRLIVDAAKQGSEEFLQEAGQSIAENLIANKLVGYDPERGTFTGAGQAGAAGFTVGALMQVFGSMIGGRRAHTPAPPPAAAGAPPPAAPAAPAGAAPAPAPPPPLGASPVAAGLQPPPVAPEAAAVLQASGYAPEDIAAMNPVEVAAAVAKAQAQGVQVPVAAAPPGAAVAPATAASPPAQATPTLPDFSARASEAPEAAASPAGAASKAAEAPSSPAAPDFSAESSAPGSRSAPVTVEKPEDLAAVAPAVNPAPTDGQKEAGNYAKAHVNVQGLDITIENPKGAQRTGKGPDGKSWSVEMPGHYGYIKRSTGADGDQVDVYVGDAPQSRRVFVVDQVNAESKAFDEHKALVGFPDQATALRTYEDGFSDGKGGADRIGGVSEMSVADFKDWVKNGDTTKALTATSDNTPSKSAAADMPAQPVEKTGKDNTPETADIEPAISAKAPGEKDAVNISQRGEAPAPAKPKRANSTKVRKPVSLVRFLAANGGLQDHRGELSRGLDLGRHFVPGIGRLVRQNGVPLDRAREAAAEAGYLGDDKTRAVAETTVSDLLDAIDREINRGQPVYSVNDREQLAAFEAQQKEQPRDEEARSRLAEEITRAIDEGGGDTSNVLYIETVTDLMYTGEVTDMDAAFERAAIIFADDKLPEADQDAVDEELLRSFAGEPERSGNAGRGGGGEQAQEGSQGRTPSGPDANREAVPVRGAAQEGGGERLASTPERGADGKPQTVLPGAERITDAELAKRKAAEPLKPKAAQQQADEGLFGDTAAQTDLVDMAKTASKPKAGPRSTGSSHGTLGGVFTRERGFKGDPYPAGPERQAFNEAFDNLVRTIETTTGPSGAVRMASTADAAWPVTTLSPARQATIAQKATDIVHRIAGSEVPVRFQSQIRTRDVIAPELVARLESAAAARGNKISETSLGYYELGAEPLIVLALNDPRHGSQQTLTTAGHEAWHHVEEVLLTAEEKATLKREMPRIAKYAAKERGKATVAQMMQMPEFEITAIAFQRYRRTREDSGLSSAVLRIFDKVLRVLRQIAAMLKGEGVQTYEDIFEAARTGEIARQAREGEATLSREELMASTAYHGSRSRHDRFSLDFINTGEGAQAYGWGLYFAGKKEIANFYRRKLAGEAGIEVAGLDETVWNKPLNRVTIAEMRAWAAKNLDLLPRDSELSPYALKSVLAQASDAAAAGDDLPFVHVAEQNEAAEAREDELASAESALEDRGNAVSLYESQRMAAEYAGRGRIAWALAAKPELAKVGKPGALYTVDIPEDDTMLHWDLPLSEQPEKVKEALRSPLIPRWRKNGAWDHTHGQHLYQTLADALGKDIKLGRPGARFSVKGMNDKAASLLLRDLGISGIKYRDASSRPAVPLVALKQDLREAQARLARWQDPAHARNWDRSGSTPKSKVQLVDAEKAVAEAERQIAQWSNGNATYNYVVFDDAAVKITAMANTEETPAGPADQSFWRSRADALIDRTDPLRIAVQDRFLRMRRWQEWASGIIGTQLPEHLDTYLAEELYHGRTNTSLEDLHKQFVRPLAGAMKRADITSQQLGDYLYARHAQERNEAIREIDPGNDAGSGMTDDEAQLILDRIAASPQAEAYRALASQIDGLQAQTRDTLVAAGLLSEEERVAWEEKYQHYAPLRGFESDPEDDAHGGSSRGIDIRGKEAQRALGRRSKADNPLAYAIMQAERAIVRSEKNTVAKTFLRFVRSFPNPRAWRVVQGERRRRLSPQTGLVEYYSVPPHVHRNEDLFGVKIGGKTTYVEILDPALSRAMRGYGNADTSNWVLRKFMQTARLFASLQTSFNPEFVLSNLLRDLQTAVVNVGDVAGRPAGIRRKIIADALTLKNVRAVISAIYNPASTNPNAQWFEEFRHAGGKVSFYGLSDLAKIKKQVEDEVNRGNMGRAVRGFLEAVDNANTAIENGTRLSVYIALRQAGLSQAKAASAALNITVNFHRKGELGPLLNTAYVFFNAAAQGTVRSASGFVKSKVVRRSVYAIFAAGVLLDFINAMLAGDDDDGKNRYDGVEQFVKDRNAILMLPNGGHLQLPLGFGIISLPYVSGQQVAAMLRGARSKEEATGSIMSAAIAALNPIGYAASLSQLIAPTLLDPIVQVGENMNWYGGPIYPTKFDRRKPDSENYFATAPAWAVRAAETLNRITGGSVGRPGSLFGLDTSISPEVLQHYVEFAGGGMARTVINAFKTGATLLKGEEVLPEQIPFVRRVYSAPTSVSHLREFYNVWGKIDQADYEVKQIAKTDPAAAKQAREAHISEIRAYPAMKAARKVLSDIEERRTAIEANERMDPDARRWQLEHLAVTEKQAVSRGLKAYSPQ